MAAILKHWREAATLIVLCRTTAAPNFTIPGSKQCNKIKTNFDYKILLLKRSGKSKFMPSAYVFPGGVASDADFSEEWVNLFQNSGIDLSKWPRAASSKVKHVDTISPMLTRKRDETFSAVPPEIAFRICAIRETFEESGLLLVRNSNSSKLTEASNKFSQKDHVSASLCGKLDEKSLSEWRKKVEKDATQFLRMCQVNNVVPDVWALYDWCNWLTPVLNLMQDVQTVKHVRRFDTAFYITVLDEMPQFIKHDSGETVHTQWLSPMETLLGYRTQSFWIAPPQLLEMLKLVQFSKVADLAHFAVNRSDNYIERWLPVKLIANDGMLNIHPGDCLYPENPDLFGTEEALERDLTLTELDAYSPKHRFEVSGKFDMKFRCDIDVPEHITPLTEHELSGLESVTPAAQL